MVTNEKTKRLQYKRTAKEQSENRYWSNENSIKSSQDGAIKRHGRGHAAINRVFVYPHTSLRKQYRISPGD